MYYRVHCCHKYRPSLEKKPMEGISLLDASQNVHDERVKQAYPFKPLKRNESDEDEILLVGRRA